MNSELKRLFEEDQNDLRVLTEGRKERDGERRRRVNEILSEGKMTEGADFFFAAIIFQHGEELSEWFLAHELAKKAAELGFEQGKWLAAVALDRWLVRQGRPAKFGNQLIPFGGVYRLPAVDPLTTDEERAASDIAPLDDLYAFRRHHGIAWEDANVLGTSAADSMRINVVRLTRHPAHSPALPGSICGHDKQGRAVRENSYGWSWIGEKGGAVDTYWLSMPAVPTIAHIVAEGELSEIRVVTYMRRPAIWVEMGGVFT
ncbi:hypothetical protein, partial [Brevibacillus borstelensis]|uniref:hypothetical protein n=1 Tax=Brevibacillus borstelensis TaxID=45462 RepID=UPI0030BCF417